MYVCRVAQCQTVIIKFAVVEKKRFSSKRVLYSKHEWTDGDSSEQFNLLTLPLQISHRILMSLWCGVPKMRECLYRGQHKIFLR